jgi:hypothetical protein
VPAPEWAGTGGFVLRKGLVCDGCAYGLALLCWNLECEDENSGAAIPHLQFEGLRLTNPPDLCYRAFPDINLIDLLLNL